jgi:hypothetical protein
MKILDSVLSLLVPRWEFSLAPFASLEVIYYSAVLWPVLFVLSVGYKLNYRNLHSYVLLKFS